MFNENILCNSYKHYADTHHLLHSSSTRILNKESVNSPVNGVRK
ncbi:hypothetical protein J5U21_00067 [Saccharolobus shibatae]|uniref:Uncharacterized protein n=1 Tax=Saccharolobus shibatae TaxID=2286 RepID=A0A8F5BS50_9CREN|nr:hypothetical protein J5U21_p0067 [Saccharolobus shibatae]QXJ30427.1 hypothetical protein J5U21_00067 [Saccharolobus shibatae]